MYATAIPLGDFPTFSADHRQDNDFQKKPTVTT